MYAFTWVRDLWIPRSVTRSDVPNNVQEDPFEDMRHLNLTSDDSMLVITSAGDNALHYAIAAKPKRVSFKTLMLLRADR